MTGVLTRWNKHLRIVRTCIAFGPVAGHYLNNLHLLWPPIGVSAVFGAYFASVLAWLVSVAPLKFRHQRAGSISTVVGIFVSICALCIYGNLVTDYVRSTERDGNRHYVVIGDQRTQLSGELYGNASDQRILERAGIEDADIEAMWVPETVRSARKQLFIAALAVWLGLNFSVGSFARATFRSSPDAGR